MIDIIPKVGTEGVITVEEGNGIETYMDVVEGISIEDISHHTLSLIQIKWKYHLKIYMFYYMMVDYLQ